MNFPQEIEWLDQLFELAEPQNGTRVIVEETEEDLVFFDSTWYSFPDMRPLYSSLEVDTFDPMDN